MRVMGRTGRTTYGRAPRKSKASAGRTSGGRVPIRAHSSLCKLSYQRFLNDHGLVPGRGWRQSLQKVGACDVKKQAARRDRAREDWSRGHDQFFSFHSSSPTPIRHQLAECPPETHRLNANEQVANYRATASSRQLALTCAVQPCSHSSCSPPASIGDRDHQNLNMLIRPRSRTMLRKPPPGRAPQAYITVTS
nr:hypothetical protein CFP56_07389 [Quercus suber]